MKIEEVNRAVQGFLREVTEENAYAKALGIPAPVMDRNLYEAKLSDDLEVVSYARVGQSLVTRRAS